VLREQITAVVPGGAVSHEERVFIICPDELGEERAHRRHVEDLHAHRLLLFRRDARRLRFGVIFHVLSSVATSDPGLSFMPIFFGRSV